MILTINGKQAALKKGSSIEYVSENRIFTDADDYSMENLRENEVFRHDFCYLCKNKNVVNTKYSLNVYVFVSKSTRIISWYFY